MLSTDPIEPHTDSYHQVPTIAVLSYTESVLLTQYTPVLKIAAHSAHMRGTKESLGGPKSWWIRKLSSLVKLR